VLPKLKKMHLLPGDARSRGGNNCQFRSPYFLTLK
jgi:hypothetical protein